MTNHRPVALTPRAPARDEAKLIRSDTSATCRRQPVILKDSARPSVRFAELAGGKTAECAAICCCCPCGLISLIILAVVRLPAGLLHRVLRKRILLRRSKKKAKLLSSSSEWNSGSSLGSGSDNRSSGSSNKIGSFSDEEFAEFPGLRSALVMVVGDSWPVRSPSAELVQLEKDVWSKFCNSGFWRSPSQREDHLTAQATEI
ncbi:uncharacterized protein LOC110092631 [Dendrobium catenatum]|uniref:Uncharacterized protein n=1 Tax=Dendrobium catenatum TaxID=906689 RepID=A0A2I0X0F1_9ASPA|nr:uncharacterized protein LOC110092631 [Dendrobium catenatum]PKU81380.1 hypothetical protein MA16_Dca017418 [Dendrobium catenatum]